MFAPSTPRSVVNVKVVTVRSVNIGIASCIDEFGAPTTISIKSMRANGCAPTVGDRWVIDRSYGNWSFALYLGPPAFGPGTVKLWPLPVAEPGWVALDGSIYKQTDLPTIYNVIGDTYNVGDEDADEFRVPAWGGTPPTSPLHVMKT